MSVCTETIPGTSTTGSPIPVFSFIDDSSLQPLTCQAVYVYWFYTGPKGTINLYASNAGVSQVASPPPVSSSTVGSSVVDATIPNITVTIATNLDPSVFRFSWSPVNVPQGWYILNASMPTLSYSAQSVPFYVRTSNNTSCITTSASSLTNSTSASLASPVRAASQSVGISIGTIIGATFGLVIVVAVIIFAYIWSKRGRKKSSRPHSKGEYPTRWKELGSADSRAAFRSSQSRPYHPSPNNSLGTVLHLAQSEEGVGAEKSSIHSKLESLAFSCEPEDVALSTLPVLKHQPSRSRTFAVDRPDSSSSSTTLGLSTHSHSPMPERRPSVHDALSKRRSLDAVGYPPTRPTSSPTAHPSQPTRDQRASMQVPTAHRQDSRLSYQPGRPATADAAKQANRQSFGKKRKPVPAYDGEEPPALPTSPASPSSSSPLETFFSTSPASSSIGHYVTRHQSTHEPGHPDPMGGGIKPLHYLIPDMPVSQH